jgi:hypothetical protein
MKVSRIYELAMELETYGDLVEDSSNEDSVNLAHAILSLLDTVDKKIGLSPDDEFPAVNEDVPFEQNWQL